MTIVATDAIPIKSYASKYDSVHLFIDQKSKFCTIIFGLENDGAKELAKYTVRVKKQYEIYGHNFGPVSLFLSFFVVASNVVTFLTRNVTKWDVTTFYGKKNMLTF